MEKWNNCIFPIRREIYIFKKKKKNDITKSLWLSNLYNYVHILMPINWNIQYQLGASQVEKWNNGIFRISREKYKKRNDIAK